MISAIVLIMLVFILPEHAKTFKEKIKFYIFGPKPLNVKRTAVLFLVAYIVFFSFIHVFAFDSQTAALGIDANSENDVAMDFGRIKTGTDSFPKDLQIINPSTMPVKGIVFCKGEINSYISKKVFNLSSGEANSTSLIASAPNETINGTYTGDIMVYSSPFWLMFPDSFIQSLLDWNAEATVYILDVLSAIVLTALTLLLLIGITFISDKIVVLAIDRSWSHHSRIIIKKNYVKKIFSLKGRIKKALSKSMGWILEIKYSKSEGKETFFTNYGKPFISSLVLIPFLFFINDPLAAMMISIILGGIIAYFISCKLRRKIVLTTLIIMTITAIHMTIQSNLIIIEQQTDMMNILSLSSPPPNFLKTTARSPGFRT